MSDAQDNSGDGSSDDEALGPIAGERLAEARRALQIPVVEIAKELHLDEYKVRAIERNEFDIIGAPVFAKGHLRKYAQLVQVAEADVMADYYVLNRASGAPPVVSMRPKLRKEMSPGPWVVAVLVLMAAAVAYWWFGVRVEGPERPPAGEIAPLQQTRDADADEASGAALSEEAIDDAAEATLEENQPLPTVVPAVVAPIESVAVGDTAQLRLSVTYSGDSWTEITDASGRRLFFDLGSAGRTVNVSGEAPFNVLFGNANNVSLAVNDAPFDIPAASRRGLTARLTITAP